MVGGGKRAIIEREEFLAIRVCSLRCLSFTLADMSTDNHFSQKKPVFRFHGTAVAVALVMSSGAGMSTALAAEQTALAPLVVTATREAQPITDSVADVVLVSRQMLEDSGLSSVDDALRRFAGLQLARNGGPGQSGGYFLRGVAAGGVVVLLDGVRIGSASLGQTDFGSMNLAQIDHIEVVRGPVSGLYGADAVGGVVNLVTRRGKGAPRLQAHAALGGYRGREAGIGLSGASGAIDYAASVGHEQNRGESAIRPGDRYDYYNPDRDGFKRTMGTVNVGVSPATGHRIGLTATEARLNAQYDSGRFDAATGLSDASPDFRRRARTTSTALDYRGELSSRWITSAQLAHGVDDDRSGALQPDHYRTTRNQATWQNTLRLQPGQQVVLGWEYLHEKVGSNSYATSGVAGASEQRTRHNQALLAGYTGQYGQLDVQASLRHDHNSAYGGQTTGSLGASQALTDRLKVRALVGTSFRAPTFNDLYYPNYGVSTLQPEKGRNAELGLVWQSSSTRAGITIYRNRIRDLIGYDPDSTGTTCPAGYFGCAANTARATLKGATLQTAHDWGFMRLTAVFDFLDARDDSTGQRLNRRATHQASIGADYLADRWSTGATFTRVGSRPDGNVRLGSYAVLDLRADWKLDTRWKLEAKLLNALDRDIEPVRDYQGLGRQFWLGVRVDTSI